MLSMVDNLQAISKSAANRATGILTPLESGQNTPPSATEMDLSMMDNEQMVQ